MVLRVLGLRQMHNPAYIHCVFLYLNEIVMYLHKRIHGESDTILRMDEGRKRVLGNEPMICSEGRKAEMPQKQKINREKVNAALNTQCSKCGCLITPAQILRVDSQRMKCPECGERCRRATGEPI